jgi:hypothetical protein
MVVSCPLPPMKLCSVGLQGVLERSISYLFSVD